MKGAAIGLLVVGLISIAMSFVWPSLVPDPKPMDEQARERYFAATSAAHGAASDGKELDQADVDELNAFNERKENFEKKKSFGSAVFKYVGILLSLAGGGIILWVTQAD